MKTKTFEKYLLLEQSGELSPRRQRLLNACPETQEKRAELTVLRTAIPPLCAEPDPWATQKIAARLREETRPVFNFSKAWKPVLLTAACVTLVVSTFNFEQTSTEPAVVAETEMDAWNNQFEADLVELESLILAMSGDSLDIMKL